MFLIECRPPASTLASLVWPRRARIPKTTIYPHLTVWATENTGPAGLGFVRYPAIDDSADRRFSARLQTPHRREVACPGTRCDGLWRSVRARYALEFGPI